MKYGAQINARRSLAKTDNCVKVNMRSAVSLTRKRLRAKNKKCSRLCKKRLKGSYRSVSSVALKCQLTKPAKRLAIIANSALDCSTRSLTLPMRRTITSRGTIQKRLTAGTGTNGSSFSCMTCPSQALLILWLISSHKKTLVRIWLRRRAKSTHRT